MVLLQDIDFIDRQIANVSRNIANLEATLQAGAKRGQFPGSQNPCGRRPSSVDCGVWRGVQGIPAQLEPLKKELDDLLFTRQQQTEQLEIQAEMDVGPVVEQPSVISPIVSQIPQNNTLRNALIIGGIALLIL